MAGTTTDKLQKLKDTKAAFYNVITAKGQTISDEPFSEWPAKVEAIETGITLPTLTSPGIAADLRQGKQLIDQEGNVVDGTLAEVEQATPSISVSSTGLITTSATQSAGYVKAGTKNATKQLSTQAGGTRTPGTSDTIIVNAGQYATGDIIMKGDTSLQSKNIISGVSIFGVPGEATTSSGYDCYEFSLEEDTMEVSSYAGTITITFDKAIKSYNGLSLFFDEFLDEGEPSYSYAIVQMPSACYWGGGFHGVLTYYDSADEVWNDSENSGYYPYGTSGLVAQDIFAELSSDGMTLTLTASSILDECDEQSSHSIGGGFVCVQYM